MQACEQHRPAGMSGRPLNFTQFCDYCIIVLILLILFGVCGVWCVYRLYSRCREYRQNWDYHGRTHWKRDLWHTCCFGSYPFDSKASPAKDDSSNDVVASEAQRSCWSVVVSACKVGMDRSATLLPTSDGRTGAAKALPKHRIHPSVAEGHTMSASSATTADGCSQRVIVIAPAPSEGPVVQEQPNVRSTSLQLLENFTGQLHNTSPPRSLARRAPTSPPPPEAFSAWLPTSASPVSIPLSLGVSSPAQSTQSSPAQSGDNRSRLLAAQEVLANHRQATTTTPVQRRASGDDSRSTSSRRLAALKKAGVIVDDEDKQVIVVVVGQKAQEVQAHKQASMRKLGAFDKWASSRGLAIPEDKCDPADARAIRSIAALSDGVKKSTRHLNTRGAVSRGK